MANSKADVRDAFLAEADNLEDLFLVIDSDDLTISDQQALIELIEDAIEAVRNGVKRIASAE